MISQTVFCNGVYMDRDSAALSPFDRGFLFGDSVYEMIAVFDGKMLHAKSHLDRLERSLSALQFPATPCSQDVLEMLLTLIKRNHVHSGRVYLQISRGNARDRAFLPSQNLSPTLFAYVEQVDLLNMPAMRKGISIITLPEQRWSRRDIKSNNLIAQCMAYQSVAQHGADDAFMVENGQITEALSANAWIVHKDGTLQTRPLSNHILAGVTRDMILAHLPPDTRLEEAAFTPQQAMEAEEAFISSASRFVVPVIAIDAKPVGSGEVGPSTRRIQRAYLSAAQLPIPNWIGE